MLRRHKLRSRPLVPHSRGLALLLHRERQQRSAISSFVEHGDVVLDDAAAPARKQGNLDCYTDVREPSKTQHLCVRA